MNSLKIIILVLFIATLSIKPITGKSKVNKISNIITNEKEIKFKDIKIIGLSPNGKYITGYKDQTNSLIIYNIENSNISFKSTTIKNPIDVTSVTWSPDSKYITFTENWSTYMNDSDIWFIDIKKKILTNLTDDNYEGATISQKKHKFFIDTLPFWTKNSKEIFFIRYNGNNNGTRLYKIILENNKIKELSKLSDNIFAISTKLFFDNTNNNIVFTLANLYKNHVENGIWSYNLKNQELTRLLLNDRKKLTPFLTSFSNVGKYSIISYKYLLGQFSMSYNDDYYYLFHLKTRNLHPIIPNRIKIVNNKSSNNKRQYSVFNSIFSPNGKHILMLCKTINHNNYIILRNLDNNIETLLIKEKNKNIGLSINNQNGIWWQKDTILILSNPLSNSAYLLKVKIK